MSIIAYSRMLSPRASSVTFLALGAAGSPIPGSSFWFNACSGAETQHIDLVSQGIGQPRQVSSLNAGHDLITITIGGNDAFFSDVLSVCFWEGDCFAQPTPEMPPLSWGQFLDFLVAMHDRAASQEAEGEQVIRARLDALLKAER